MQHGADLSWHEFPLQKRHQQPVQSHSFTKPLYNRCLCLCLCNSSTGNAIYGAASRNYSIATSIGNIISHLGRQSRALLHLQGHNQRGLHTLRITIFSNVAYLLCDKWQQLANLQHLRQYRTLLHSPSSSHPSLKHFNKHLNCDSKK